MIFFLNSRRGHLIMAFATINQTALPKATTTTTAPAKIPAIEEAFISEPSLRKRIYDAIGMDDDQTYFRSVRTEREREN